MSATLSGGPPPIPPGQPPRRRPMSLGCAFAVLILMAVALIAALMQDPVDDMSDATATPEARIESTPVRRSPRPA